jgi:hypothetical protein
MLTISWEKRYIQQHIKENYFETGVPLEENKKIGWY